jgi:hypothetical protein
MAEGGSKMDAASSLQLARHWYKLFNNVMQQNRTAFWLFMAKRLNAHNVDMCDTWQKKESAKC